MFSRAPLSRSPITLADLVDEVTIDLNQGPQQAGSVVESTDLAVTPDRLQMRVALQNLIGNAAASRQTGVPLVIRVFAESAGPAVAVRVSDNGKGLSAEDRLRVMEPMTRLYLEGTPGTGSAFLPAHGLPPLTGEDWNFLRGMRAERRSPSSLQTAPS